MVRPRSGSARLRRFTTLLTQATEWETWCRNAAVARVVRAHLRGLPDRARVLDVGCGSGGIATFLPEIEVVGTDIERPSGEVAASEFHVADISQLPFDDDAFPITTCIDVLEHLPLEKRAEALAELVRVTKHVLVVACPHGAGARDCDDAYRRVAARRGQRVEAWVAEHLRQEYPTRDTVVTEIENALRSTNRTANVSVTYNEPLVLAHIIRQSAARSSLLYLTANVALGAVAFWPLVVAADRSYRMIISVTFNKRPT